MKKIIHNIIYYIINIIDLYQYSNKKFNENDITKKIINSFNIQDWKIYSEDGWQPLTYIHITQPYTHWIISTNNRKLQCADEHLIYSNNQWKHIKNLNIGDIIYTKYGPEKITKIEKTNIKTCMYDVTVDSYSHSYYANSILSHNTIITCIFLLWYVLFNNNKNIMIAANKRDTVVEIVDKIKNIYKLLPFWIKPGVVGLNNNKIVFENDCRIMSTGRSKEPAIGFTIDVLYMDEFAHIPKTYIEPYYSNAIPVISSLTDSKVIISSTPNGDNLFKKLVDGALLPDTHPDKNPYVLNKVYWNEVEGRDSIWFELSHLKLNELNLSVNTFLDTIKKLGFRIFKELTNANGKLIKCYHDNFNYDNVSQIAILPFSNTLKLCDVSNVTSWKHQEINNLGGGSEGEELFNAQYNLLFFNGSKVTFNKELMSRLHGGIGDFVYVPIPQFSILPFEFKELVWLRSMPHIFNPKDIKTYSIIITLDLAEGIGKDYSVINIFRVLHLSNEELQKIQIYNDISDFFRLHQIGVYRSHRVSSEELAHLLYMIVWNLFNPESVKIVLEYNTYGAELLKSLRLCFGGNNNFGTFPFFMYQHSKDRPELKIGFKVNGVSKNINVRKFQTLCENKKINVYHQESVQQMDAFTKHETASGNIKFCADSGHDDIVMSMVNLATLFDNTQYKSMLEVYLEYGSIDPDIKNLIEHKLSNRNVDSISNIADYAPLLDALEMKRQHEDNFYTSVNKYDLILPPEKEHFIINESGEWGNIIAATKSKEELDELWFSNQDLFYSKNTAIFPNDILGNIASKKNKNITNWPFK